MTDATITDEEWETLCRGCGGCCFQKIENERGTIFCTQTPCDLISRHAQSP